MVCIFIKYKSTFFLVIKQISIFIKYRFEFFLKKFSFFILFYKIADFEISKKELRVRLKSFILICDACIVSLFHECDSSFKKSSFFYPFKKQIWFFFFFFLQIKSFFFYLAKTDLIFINPILFKFFFLSFKKIDLIFKNQIFFFFFQIFKTYLIFLLKDDIFIRQICLN